MALNKYMLTKNQKISKGLKSHYRAKKVKRDVKRIMLFIAIIAIANFIIGTPVQAPEARQWGLPRAEAREMSVVEEIRQIAREEDRGEWATYLVKLSYCESRHNPSATNSVGNTPAGSVDRGLFMYNSYWQSQVSDECAFSVDCSTRQTIKMIEAGKQHLWVCNSYVKGVPIEIVMK